VSAVRFALDTRRTTRERLRLGSYGTGEQRGGRCSGEAEEPQPSQCLASGDEAVRVVFGDLLRQVALVLGHLRAS
jgi:hypothetical protein